MPIDATEFGSITVDGKTYEHDVIIRLSGKVEKRRKRLSKEKFAASQLFARPIAFLLSSGIRPPLTLDLIFKASSTPAQPPETKLEPERIVTRPPATTILKGRVFLVEIFAGLRRQSHVPILAGPHDQKIATVLEHELGFRL